ncbi:MAG: hypothetical protein WCC58_05225 [Burkholderiales bacterium]
MENLQLDVLASGERELLARDLLKMNLRRSLRAVDQGVAWVERLAIMPRIWSG